MTEKGAILGFMMGERVKAALIAATQMAMVIEGLPDPDRLGATKVFSTYLQSLYRDLGLGQKIYPQEEWTDLRKELDSAMVMVESKVAHASLDNLSKAITHATTISNRAMTFLTEKGLL